jgi:hypothetical protein
MGELVTHRSSLKSVEGGECFPRFVIASRRRGNHSGGAFLEIDSSSFYGRTPRKNGKGYHCQPPHYNSTKKVAPSFKFAF